MELVTKEQINEYGPAVFLPPFIGVFDDSFRKFGSSQLEQFLNKVKCKKWLIFSDYSLNDKANHTVTFSLVPYVFKLKQLQKLIHLLAPTDLKNTQHVNPALLGFFNQMPIMHITIILDKNRRLNKNEKEFFQIKTSALIDQLHVWCETTPEGREHYVDQVKRLKVLSRELTKKSPNLRVIRDMEIVAVLASYLIAQIARLTKLELISWFSDRDALLNFAKSQTTQPIIFDLIDIYSHVLLQSVGVDGNPKLGFGIPEESSEMWYDHLNRLSDFVSGTIADYDLERNLVSLPKFQSLIQGAIASNPNVLIYQIAFNAQNPFVSRISIARS